MNEAESERHSDDLLRCTGETKEGWLLQAASGEYEILRKDTIAGKCAFSFFSVYCLFFCMQRYDTGEGRVGESPGIELHVPELYFGKRTKPGLFSLRTALRGAVSEFNSDEKEER